MRRKKASLTGPSHFNAIYKPPSISTNNNTANQKQIQQHIPTHTTEKKLLPFPGCPSISAGSGCPSKQPSFSAYPQGEYTEDFQAEVELNYKAMGPLHCQQFLLFSALGTTLCFSHCKCSNITQGRGHSLVWEPPEWFGAANANTGARNCKSQTKRQGWATSCH